MSFGLKLPLVVLAGVTMGVLNSTPSTPGISLCVAAIGVALACSHRHSSVRNACLWGAVLAAAFAYGAYARECAQMPIPEWVFHPESPLVLEGRVERDASAGDAGVRLELTDVQVILDRHAIALPHIDVLAIIGGNIAAAGIEQWTAGRRVSMPARLRIPAVVRNPGSPSIHWQTLTRPFDVIAAVKSGSLIEVRAGSFWQERAAAIRRYVRRVCHEWLGPRGADSAAVVTAILIGDRAGLDPEVMRRLQAAGTFHVIAISGGNVAVLTTLSFFGLRLVIRRERLVVLGTLLVVLAYGLVVGRDASVMRALLAAVLYLGLRLVGLSPQPLNVLALTALICVIVEPLMVLDVGAWLSFGATLGLIAVLPRLKGSEASAGGMRQVLRVSRGLLLATIAAELMILPVMASIFMRVGVAGLPLNFLAIPAMTMVQVSGLVLSAAAPWSSSVASVAAMVAHMATNVLTGSASLVDSAPWLSWRVPPPPIPVVVLYYLALLFAMTWSGQRRLTRWAIGATAVCGLALASGPWTAFHRPAGGWLRVSVLDVGQGESVAVQLPGGHVLLVDAGGSSGGFDVGGRLVTPALWASGVARIDWLALTHGDVDHVGGAIRVAEDLRPAEVWEGVPVPGVSLIDRLRHRPGLAWRRVLAGHRVESSGATIDVLHPPLPDWERRRVRNDDSLVFRIRYGLVEVLLTGDAGAEFESSFVADSDARPIRLLKVGHHGSKTSTSEAFLDSYAPTAAVISAGQNNLFGHPAPAVLGRLAQRGIDVFRTDRDGAVVIETDGRVAYLRTAVGRTLSVISHAATPVPSLP